MQRRFHLLVVGVLVLASALVVRTDVTPSQSADVQLLLGDLLYAEGKYQDSLEAYRNAVRRAGPDMLFKARAGLIRSALRCAEFEEARQAAQQVFQSSPRNPEAMALYADTLWASGLFDQADAKYRDALAMVPDFARGRHGLARSLGARGQLVQGMDEAQAALRLSPRDLEIHHTIGTLYERMHKFEEAAAAYGNYVNLLPNKDTSDEAAWARAEVRFLQSFGRRVPFEVNPGADDKVYTVPFRIIKDKIVVRARVNDALSQDFVVDTGSEYTVITRPTAQRLGIAPVTYTLSAGVGSVGFRGLQLARANTLEVGGLKLRNVPLLVKNPPLTDTPSHETESLSPLALGYSMIVDYRAHEITFGKHIPEEPSDVALPLRMHRLATVQGTVDGLREANFVVDTGGEVISISQATATALGKPKGRHIALKVWGTSGWDPDAFLLPGVNLKFDAIQYKNFSVVVLNLDAPSALLGFQLGGIVGHRFLSNYRVGIDLERSTLRLKKI